MCAVLSGTSQAVRYHSYLLQLLWVLLILFAQLSPLQKWYRL